MKYALIVQGVGNGHLTQALSIYQKLNNSSNNNIKVYISNNEPPQYIKDEIIDYRVFKSFNFYYNKNGISIKKTILNNILLTPTIIIGYIKILKELKKINPDRIFNFYDMLGLFLPKNKTVSIAHQYKFITKEYKFKKGLVKKLLLKTFTKLTCLNSNKIYALSWYPYNTDNEKVEVIPPILRSVVYKRFNNITSDFYLCYINNNLYFEQIKEWANKNHNKVVLYNNQIDGKFGYLTAKKISSEFLSDLKICKAFISTAGFESISEALLYNKDVYVVPLNKQYEQSCNAHDLKLNGLGNTGLDFNSIEFIKSKDISKWISSGENIISNLIE